MMRDQFGNDSSDYMTPAESAGVKDYFLDRRLSLEPQQRIDVEDE